MRIEADNPASLTEASGSLGRALALRGRGDLVAVPQTIAGRTCWAVKDPVALRYFHLSDEEYCVLRALDGTTSLERIQQEFEDRFAPRRLSRSQLQSFLGLLHQEGLILADAPGQTEVLLARANALKRRTWLSALANPLAIRFPGVDPQPFLDWLLPNCRWLFSSGSLTAGLLLIAGALLLLAANLDLVRSRLPEAASLIDASTILWLAVTLAAIKVLHELGHALACRRFGAECHELGLMLLVFTPCLYCNVSDSWMIESKWRRAAIGAAGVWIELLLASAATLLWWFSEPGLLNSLCFNVMLVSSVSTLLFNGNPLMRYDGYFVLCDLVEIPNLAEQAATVARDELAALALGIPCERDEQHSPAQRAFLAVYALASIVYRALVLFGVFWIVHGLMKRRHLEVLALALAACVLTGLMAFPLWRGVQFLQNAYWSRQMKPRRAIVSAFLFVAILTAGLLIPLPYHVAAPALLDAEGARPVYAMVAGTLERGLEPGARVAVGEQIAVLKNLDLELEIARLRGERDQQKLRLKNLRHRQTHDTQAAAQIPVAEEALVDLEERLERRLGEATRLTLRAPAAGVVLPGRRRPEKGVSGELPTWSGLPLDPINRGSYLETGVLVCQVGNPERLEATLILDQTDVDSVRPGQEVEILLAQDPARRHLGTVRDIAEIDLKITPLELLPEGALPTRPDEAGVMRPAGAVYQARVALENPGRTLLIGEAGQAKIRTASRSLAQRFARYLSRTFGFER